MKEQTPSKWVPNTLVKKIFLVVQLSTAVAFTTGFYLIIIDFAAHLDGPGIGFKEWAQTTFILMLIISPILFLAAIIVVRNWRWILISIAAGPLLFGALLGTRTGQRMLKASWKARCEAGEAKACNALAGLYWAGITVEKDEARAAELDARACQGGNMSGCATLFEKNIEQYKEQSCTTVKKMCERKDSIACGLDETYCSGGE